MKSFTKLTMMQMKLFLRQPVALFFTIVFPVALLLLFGTIWGNEPGFLEGTTYGYIDLQVPALAGIVIGTVAFMSIPIATATAREQRVLRRYKATPMHPASYIAADVVVNLIVSLIGMTVLVTIGKLVYGLRFGGNWLLLLIGFLLSALAFITLGYVVASVAPNSRIAQVLGQVLFFPMMFLSGAAMPLSIMPQAIQDAAQFNPMTQMVNLLTDVWYGAGWNGTASAVMLAILIGGFLLSARIFRWE